MLKGNPRGATLVANLAGTVAGATLIGATRPGRATWWAVGGKPGEGNPKSNPGRGKRGKEAGQPWQGPAALVRATWRGCCEGNGATVVKNNQGNFGGGNWGQLWP